MVLPNVKIKEKSWLAKLATKRLGVSSVAMVLGKTICLWGVSKNEFLSNENWVKHELKHVEQYKRYGYFGFLVKYVWLSIRDGYENNPLEVEAREAEKE